MDSTLSATAGHVRRADVGDVVWEDIYRRALEEGAKMSVPMLVSNPDKVRPDENLSAMPGALGDEYERLLNKNAAAAAAAVAVFTANKVTSSSSALGASPPATELKSRSNLLVTRIGKPYKNVFNIALAAAAATGNDADNDDDDDDGARMIAVRNSAIMVGDSLATDITGACNAEIASLWVVMNGVHSNDMRIRMLQERREEDDDWESSCKEVIEGHHSSTVQSSEEAAAVVVAPTFIIAQFSS
jgi:ribonucleotide monophosphatase NagD (HAD superfamily)